MDSREIGQRLRIGLALLAGYALGRAAAALWPEQGSTAFVIAFATGVVLTQAVCRRLRFGLRGTRRRPRKDPD